MIDKRVDSIAEALDGLSDGATIMISGFGGSGEATHLVKAMEATSVRELTIVMNSIRHLFTAAPLFFEQERVRKIVVSAARFPGREPGLFERQVADGKIELEMVPQGTFSERLRAAGAGIPAFYTRTGAGTTLSDGREMRRFGEHDYVLEEALHGDFAFIGAQRADRWGNVLFRGTQANFGPGMAVASKVAIVQVREATDEPIEPNSVDIPGIYVQRVWQQPA